MTPAAPPPPLVVLLAKCRAATHFEPPRTPLPDDLARVASGDYARTMRARSAMVARAVKRGLVTADRNRFRLTEAGAAMLDEYLARRDS